MESLVSNLKGNLSSGSISRKVIDASKKFRTTWKYFSDLIPKLVEKKARFLGHLKKGETEKDLKPKIRNSLIKRVKASFLLLTEKLVYPYDSITSLSSFKDPIPERKSIFNMLTRNGMR